MCFWGRRRNINNPARGMHGAGQRHRVPFALSICGSRSMH